MAQKKSKVHKLTGGLNLVASAHEVKPGEALTALNYELDVEGTYTRIEGYERFDGQPSPSKFNVESYTDEADYLAQLRTGTDAARALIQPVPGTGPVRGVVMFNNVVYAWRDSIAADKLQMYQSTPAGWQEVVTGQNLLPGGRVELVAHNFLANSSGLKLYGCDGVNPAFEFDGTSYTQIISPVTGKEPFHMAVFSDHLFSAYRGGALFCSALKTPTSFEATNGATQWGLSGEITGLSEQPGGALAILCKNRVELIYGNNKDDFQKNVYSPDTGAKEWTAQVLGEGLYLDDRGVGQLSRSQAFGNFDYASISKNIRPTLKLFINESVGSLLVRGKNQYRLFFENGEGLIATFNELGLIGWTNFSYPELGACFYSSEDNMGFERSFMGTQAGYVMELDQGRSFDGLAIQTIFRPVFMHQGAADRYKHYFSLMLESSAEDVADIQVRPDFDFSTEEIPLENITRTVLGSGGYYDSDRWDLIRYGVPIVNRQPMPMTGDGTSVSCLIVSESDFQLPHTLQSLTIRYKYLGRVI